MLNILKADFIRLRKSFAFWISMFAMLLVAGALMMIQATAMNYTVSLSRVIFLPMSMYGIAMAGFVSVFTGADFSDGFIRNKLLAFKYRESYVISQIIVCCMACVIVYLVVTVLTAGVGRFFFENDVKDLDFIRFFVLGIGMSLVSGCLFCVITLICCNKTKAIICCMGLAFVMLVLAMDTNAVLVHMASTESVFYSGVDGFRHVLYGICHDANPCGQAAQLSSWKVWHPIRMMLIDILLIVVLSALACFQFRRKDIQ